MRFPTRRARGHIKYSDGSRTQSSCPIYPPNHPTVAYDRFEFGVPSGLRICQVVWLGLVQQLLLREGIQRWGVELTSGPFWRRTRSGWLVERRLVGVRKEARREVYFMRIEVCILDFDFVKKKN